MAEYRTPVDICNRGIQHFGGQRIDPVLGFAENSRAASECGFCYGKLREAELRRNVWTFATRRTLLRAIDTGTMLLRPALWGPLTTFFVGSIVSDENNNLWISVAPDNLGTDPLNSLLWEPYFGPLTVQPYDSGISYFAGDLVYTAAGDGTGRVYLSLQADNTTVPGTATAYDATVSYFKNQVVTYLGTAYMSLIDLNKANTPAAAPVLWNVDTTYAAAATVAGSNGVIYSSVDNGNLGNDPTQDNGTLWTNTGVLSPWTSVFTGGTGSVKWLQIGGAEFPAGVGLATLNIIYPLGSGPLSQGATRKIFKLPAGFLREAPQNPKATATALGGPSGITYNDWNFEAGYLLSDDSGPIPFRFVANVVDVTRMDPMFCEGLAARVGLEVCESLTQSTAKLGNIAKIYTDWMGQARSVNAIEQGYDEPPQDDYITVRA